MIKSYFAPDKIWKKKLIIILLKLIKCRDRPSSNWCTFTSDVSGGLFQGIINCFIVLLVITIKYYLD